MYITVSPSTNAQSLWTLIPRVGRVCGKGICTLSQLWNTEVHAPDVPCVGVLAWRGTSPKAAPRAPTLADTPQRTVAPRTRGSTQGIVLGYNGEPVEEAQRTAREGRQQ